MTRVVCMVQKGAEITAEACIQAQTDERCFCIKAVAALQALGEVGEPATLRARTMLITLRSRAAGMYRQPPERRYAGPALRVYNEQIQAQTERAKPFEEHLLKALDLEPIPAPVTPAVIGPVDVQRCCASDDCFNRIGKKSPHAKCHGCRERDLRRSAAKPRFCKVSTCRTQLRAPNYSDHCSICAKRLERMGEPMGEPSKESVVKSLPGVVDAAVEKVEAQLREKADQAADFHRSLRESPPPLRDPESLPHEYLIACVKEARRRLAALDEHFTFVTTTKEH